MPREDIRFLYLYGAGQQPRVRMQVPPSLTLSSSLAFSDAYTLTRYAHPPSPSASCLSLSLPVFRPSSLCGELDELGPGFGFGNRGYGSWSASETASIDRADATLLASETSPAQPALERVRVRVRVSPTPLPSSNPSSTSSAPPQPTRRPPQPFPTPFARPFEFPSRSGTPADRDPRQKDVVTAASSKRIDLDFGQVDDVWDVVSPVLRSPCPPLTRLIYSLPFVNSRVRPDAGERGTFGLRYRWRIQVLVRARETRIRWIQVRTLSF